MVLIDTYNHRTKSAHLVASTIEELHYFASLVPLPESRFENKRGKNQPHYDVRSVIEYGICILDGAKPVTRKELFQFLKDNYGKQK